MNIDTDTAESPRANNRLNKIDSSRPSTGDSGLGNGPSPGEDSNLEDVTQVLMGVKSNAEEAVRRTKTKIKVLNALGRHSTSPSGNVNTGPPSRAASDGRLTRNRRKKMQLKPGETLASQIQQNAGLRDWNLSRSRIDIRPEIEIQFVKKLQKKHECPVCCQVLRYPVQFEDCGHRCCSSCLPELLRVAPRCPIDQTHVERDKVYVDKAFQREIDNLAVKCSNCEHGCKWEAVLKDLMPHLEECNYSIVQCPKECDAEFERRFLTKHIRDDCPNRDIECEFCQCAISFKDEVEHLKTCDKFPVPCPNGCKKKDIPREQIPDHLDHECTKQDVACPFNEAGCNFKCARKEMGRHLKEDPEKHLDLVCKTLLLYKNTLDIHSKAMDTQGQRIVTIENKVDALEKLYGSQLLWKIDNYSEKLEDAKAGKKSTIFSPPFLTSRHGYKLALSACLYGDGKARGKFMSLFICICKGEYDALLLWPFCHRVTFTLIDQCQDPAARRNVTYTVKPNTCKENKPFLGRPNGERNASFGAQKMVELEVMNTLDYIRDDTIFIKVNIDSDDMIML